MSATTSVWNVEAGTEWRIWRSWRRAAKHLDTVRWSCVRIDKSRSRYIPRSRTYIAGVIGTSWINMADTGSWCSRRLVVHHRLHRTSVVGYYTGKYPQICVSKPTKAILGEDMDKSLRLTYFLGHPVYVCCAHSSHWCRRLVNLSGLVSCDD